MNFVGKGFPYKFTEVQTLSNSNFLTLCTCYVLTLMLSVYSNNTNNHYTEIQSYVFNKKEKCYFTYLIKLYLFLTQIFTTHCVFKL